MKDVMLVTYDNYLDLEIEDGEPLLLEDHIPNNDQRACVSAYMVQGTVPGAPDIGVDWSLVLDGKESFIQLDNSVRMNIEQNGGTYGTAVDSYVPIYLGRKDDGSLDVNVIKIGGNNVTA